MRRTRRAPRLRERGARGSTGQARSGVAGCRRFVDRCKRRTRASWPILNLACTHREQRPYPQVPSPHCLGGTVPTLRIEHAISDFSTWREAFDRFADRRKAGGVVREQVLLDVDDPLFVFVDLEFSNVKAARAFQQFLKTQVWSTPANSPALEGSPRSRIADSAPLARGQA